MKFSTALAAAASLLASADLAVAAPRVVQVDSRDLKVSNLGGKTLRISQSFNEGFRQHGRGPRALAKAYDKYGLNIPPKLLEIIQNILEEMGIKIPEHARPLFGNGTFYGNVTDSDEDDQGEVSATPELFDVEYLAPVEIGTPPQTLMLNFDTGSSDFWVFSSETPARQQNGHVVYDIEASSTAERLEGHIWSISYGDGSRSSGNVYLDTVSIGGIEVERQAVESATRVSQSFTSDNASSGIVGLGFDSINTISPNSQKTFFSNALDSLAMPLFSANLKKAEPGNYNFGFIDPTEFTGPLSFVDVNSTAGFWEFEATGFSVGNSNNSNSSSLPFPNTTSTTQFPHTAIADTGTTLLMLPAVIATAYYAAVPSAYEDDMMGGYVFACNETLPDLTLDIGSYKAVIEGELINFAPADTDSFDTATLCFGGVQSAEGFPFAIYGDVFFKSQFTVFQMGEEPKLGFAPKPLDD